MKTAKSSVEPRLQARRIEVKRDAGRRRLRTLLGLVIVTFLTIAAIGLVNSSWLDVDGFVIEGAERTDPVLIEQATSIERRQPLLDVDTGAAELSVEQLPWVLDADVDRGWNGTISVTVTEREPVIALPIGEGFVLVDGTGRQLEPVDVKPVRFMPIAGIEATGTPGEPAPPETQAVLRLLGELTPDLELEVDQVVVDEGTLYLDLRSGGRAKLGDDTALEEKMISLETILARVDRRCLWEVDVRVPSAPAVTRIDAAGNPRATLTDLSQCS